MAEYTGAPILAVWDIGKGRAAAYTTDCSPHWAPRSFCEWEYYPTFWSNMIHWLANKIGYRPNLAARMLRTQRSNTIAFIIPTDERNRNANFFYMDILLGIQQKLWEIGFNVIVSNYNSSTFGERSLNALEVCRKQWVDGVIFVPSSRSEAQLNVLKEMNIPFVLVDRQVQGTDNYSFVVSDHEQGAYDAVQLLARNGYKKIGFIGGALRVSSGYEHYQGYVRAIGKRM